MLSRNFQLAPAATHPSSLLNTFGRREVTIVTCSLALESWLARISGAVQTRALLFLLESESELELELEYKSQRKAQSDVFIGQSMAFSAGGILSSSEGAFVIVGLAC